LTPLALLQAALGRVGFAALYVGAGEATAASRSREERAREELRHSPTRPGVAASLVCMLARRSSSGHGGLLGVCAYHALLLPRARQSIMGIEARSSRDQPRLPLALSLSRPLPGWMPSPSPLALPIPQMGSKPALAAQIAIASQGAFQGDRPLPILAANLAPCLVAAAAFAAHDRRSFLTS